MSTASKASKVPKAVQDWVRTHKGWRTPVYDPGKYATYAESRMSMCWGSHGGIAIPGGYRVATCTPSPRSKGDTGFMFYDFIQETK